MEPTQSLSTGLLKKILFRQSTRHSRLQPLWARLHTLAIFGMNYGGGGLIETSGEIQVLTDVVGKAFSDVASPVVFDVGANIGDYSLCVKRHLPAAQIYAFEPALSTFQQLEKHLAAAGNGNIKPYNIGFSDAEKTVELHSYTIEGQEVSLLASIDVRQPTQVVDVKTSASERIQVQTIDRFCEVEGIERIEFLKLDVEGHELAVLRGAQRMLRDRRIKMIQFEFGPANIYSRTFFYDFWSLLAEDFELFRIVPNGIVPIRYYGEHLEVFLTTNYLAIQKKDS
ncbi:MAG TPA: FkbM family methyltransferase [Pyrinomonadaceae bacterium]|nr:FkbM family methyltransferase [Pyrinomonadaceae bacterium]